MFDALVSGIFGLAGQSKDRQYAKEDREYQEKYEDPKAIRKRFESAGFNPMLAYGGNGSSTIAPTIGHGNSTQQLVASVFEGHQQDKIARAQIEQENERLRLIAEDLALRAPDTKINTRSSGVGSGVRNSVEQAETDPTVRKVPSPLTVGDDDAHTENILGVSMNYDASDRNEAAGGDILGNVQTISEWWGKGMDQTEAAIRKMRGGWGFSSGNRQYQIDPNFTFNRKKRPLTEREKGGDFTFGLSP